jgi:hypothetical protein
MNDSPTPPTDHASLKARQREIRDQFPESLGLRVHRALSWLGRAEREIEDQDAHFIFLWIAFNSAYANELPDGVQFSERRVLENFVRRLVALDRGRLLATIVWEEFPRSIRLIINNRFVYQPFWDHHNGRLSEQDWQGLFAKDREHAHLAVGRQDTAEVLKIVLSRLYTLRNQLVHGGATWGGSVNREQVRDATQIMGKIVPVIIHLMMENSSQVWGTATYPVVD